MIIESQPFAAIKVSTVVPTSLGSQLSIIMVLKDAAKSEVLTVTMESQPKALMNVSIQSTAKDHSSFHLSDIVVETKVVFVVIIESQPLPQSKYRL
ncbi:MAG: hypothetical protein R2728_05580 [Chitinophagales bacterium]